MPLQSNFARSNLTFAEQEAIRSLSDNPDIVIKEADKGGFTVIMDKEDYEMQLNN